MGNMQQLVLVLSFLLILAIAPHSTGASYCVCKSGLQTGAYQKAIDYACGAGADCNPIKQNGQCYNPNSIQAHCSFAANSYFQKNAIKGATCDFQGAATLTNSDPSSGSCSFSASSGGSTSTGTPTPVTTVPTTSPTTPTSTPVTPVYGGGGGGGGAIPVTPVSGTGTPTSGTGTGMGTGTGIGTGTGTNPTPTSPYTPNVGNPTGTGVLGGGGFGSGLAPTGSSMYDNHGIKLEIISLRSALVALVMSGIMWM